MISESESLLDTLPPVQPGASAKTQLRRFQLHLPTEVYLKLEIESARRAVTSYKLAATIIGMFLSGKLVVKKDPIEPPAGSDLVGVNHES